MLTTTGLIYAGGLAAIPFVARVWVRFKMERRAKAEETLPLFDLVALEIATTPRPGSGDDPDVLAEIRQTLTYLNRRKFATEFWTLDEQLAAFYKKVPVASKATVTRTAVRFIESPDRWLQIVGAKTVAALGVREAVPAIDALLSGDQLEPRFRDELSAARNTLAA